MISLYQSVLLWHLSSYWFTSLAFMCLDYYWYKTNNLQYKIGGDLRHVPSNKKILKAFIIVLLNQALTVPLMYYISPYCIDTTDYSLIVQCYRAPILLSIYIIFADQWFYWTHRLLHYNRFMYRHVHYLHHEWTYPIAIRAVYAHPIEHYLANIGTIVIGPLFFKPSHGVLCLWVVLATINSVFAHCGTILPFTDTSSHDLHHRYLNCNYGTMGLSDRIYKTQRTI